MSREKVAQCQMTAWVPIMPLWLQSNAGQLELFSELKSTVEPTFMVGAPLTLQICKTSAFIRLVAD
jgi:hypothetical protein